MKVTIYHLKSVSVAEIHLQKEKKKSYTFKNLSKILFILF